jgi:hypothetical protein
MAVTVIKALTFDLDSCLAAADEVGESLFAPAFEAIRLANDGAVPEARLRAAFADCWRFPFDFVADKYGFPRPCAPPGLGPSAIQILRPGVTASSTATHHIHNLGELKQFLRSNLMK